MNIYSVLDLSDNEEEKPKVAAKGKDAAAAKPAPAAAKKDAAAKPVKAADTKAKGVHCYELVWLVSAYC